jgi:hypothetical protein
MRLRNFIQTADRSGKWRYGDCGAWRRAPQPHGEET